MNTFNIIRTGEVRNPSPYTTPETEVFRLYAEANFCESNFKGSKNEDFSGENDFDWGDE